MSASAAVGSTWAPLRRGVFRALWLAVLVSNVGLWMQTVGAQWLLVSQPNATVLVALVQTADMLPDLLFGLVGGILADTFDRRWLLIVVNAVMAVTAAALTLLTLAGQMPPALLLIFTFLLGSGSVVTLPAYQALIPDLVPRSELHAASALGSVSINLARAVGPAIAGIVIAQAGVAAVFGLNAASYVIFLAVVTVWRPASSGAKEFPEQFGSALRAGGRYVRHSPVVRRILLRSALFLIPGSALWALLPLIASQRLQQGAGGYGLLLGALGTGAVAGAFILPRLQAKMTSNAMIGAASLAYAAVLVAVVLPRNLPVTLAALLLGGVSWMAVLSHINAELQLFLPDWVRARGLSIYQMVLFGSQAVGALAWGFVALPLGLVPTFLVAAFLMLAAVGTLRFWPLIDTANIDSRVAAYWPEPQLVFDARPHTGPVVVSNVYTVSADKEASFIAAMSHVRRSRLRTGATRWGLFRDGETPHQFVELFAVASWEEHLRQHTDRLTGFDQEYEEKATALSDPPGRSSHLLSVEVED